jgi:hypothetical protein
MCWDRNYIVILSASNTSKAPKHLANKHQILDFETGSQLQTERPTQAGPLAGSERLIVLQQQLANAFQRPSQAAVNTVFLLIVQ